MGTCRVHHPGGPDTAAARTVHRQLEQLVQGFRTGDRPMPVFALHAAGDGEPDAPVEELVRQLYAVQEAHGTRCALISGERHRSPGDLVRMLSDPQTWAGPGASYRRYVFPRLRLVHAIEDAARRLRSEQTNGASSDGSENFGRSGNSANCDAPDSSASPASSRTSDRARPPYDVSNRRAEQKQLLDNLADQGWRPVNPSRRRWGSWGATPLFDTAHVLPASLVTAFAALLARGTWLVAMSAGVGFLVLLTLLNYALPGRAPIFLWLRRESRWFMTTTFLRTPDADPEPSTGVSPLHPIRSWRAIAARAYEVAEDFWASEDDHLRLCVLALCEDLRDNHRRWSWDLRGFKRLRPPMLFLPGATEDNGGIPLIQAVDEIRGRRSELDPLVMVASVARADGTLLPVPAADAQNGTDGPLGLGQGFTGRLTTRYRQWARRLRAQQSWVLRIPVPGDRVRNDPVPDDTGHGWTDHDRASGRPTPARLVWSLHSLVLVVAALITIGVTHATGLHDQYCSASLLTANRDTRLMGVTGGEEKECVGIATEGLRFADQFPGKTSDDGKAASYATPWTLGRLERDVDKENRRVLREHKDKYVTVVYAGPLSPDPGGGTSPVKGVEELAGVYLAQRVVNDKYPVKLRVLIANGGVDLNRQTDMAEAIKEYAAHDPTVVGVVGMGRDLKSSDKATGILADAELPVVSGTNSATYLPKRYANWFSLAAPDEWQTEQLGLIAGQLRAQSGKATQHALVLARNTAENGDRYTTEQARYGQQMLRDKGFSLLKQLRYRLSEDNGSSGTPEFPTDQICKAANVPSVIYFAGRVEDADPLMTQLNTVPGCAHKQISVLTGDDLSKATFTSRRATVAPDVTLYHAALADLEDAAADGTTFYDDATNFLSDKDGDGNKDGDGDGDGNKDHERFSVHSSSLASGQTALAHDATRALYAAASRGNAPQSRAATWINLRSVELEGMATGTIDFTHAPLYGPRTGHGIVLNEVRRTADGRTTPRLLCARTSGDTRPLTQQECAISRPPE